jgi:hypothetical protein
MKHFRRVLPLLLLALLVWPISQTEAAPVAAPTAAPSLNDAAFQHYSETGHNVSFVIKRFYDAHGGPEVFGFPLTEAFKDTASGLTVQYFEKGRIEIRDEVAEGAQLTPLGRIFSQGRSDVAFQPVFGSSSADVLYFPESMHTLGGAFRWFWESHGGLPTFGYPLSEEFVELDPSTNEDVLVQYFERARFEYRQGNEPYNVVLSNLGWLSLHERADAAVLSTPVSAVVLLGEATTGFPASAAEREHNIKRAADLFDGVMVPAGVEYSFNSISDFSVEDGFVDGYGIVGDRLERVLAGGLCQVSTTLFRAVSNAGLQITMRQGHSRIVNFYENILGFDATVFTPDIDFRFRNDTAAPIYITTLTDTRTAKVTFKIWGVSDGRTIAYRGPVTRNWVEPGPAVWAYDPSMPAGKVKQLVHGRRGVTVNYYRTVTMPDGSVRHSDNYYTHYLPWADFYSYGKGVKPPAGVIVR